MGYSSRGHKGSDPIDWLTLKLIAIYNDQACSVLKLMPQILKTKKLPSIPFLVFNVWIKLRSNPVPNFSIFKMWDFSGGSDAKASAYNEGDQGSIPGSGRSPGEGNGNSV